MSYGGQFYYLLRLERKVKFWVSKYVRIMISGLKFSVICLKILKQLVVSLETRKELGSFT